MKQQFMSIDAAIWMMVKATGISKQEAIARIASAIASGELPTYVDGDLGEMERIEPWGQYLQ